MTSGRIRVGVMDDHPFVATGLGSLFPEDGDLELSWSTAKESEALEKVEANLTDVIVLDLRLDQAGGTVDGISVLQRIHEVRPKLPVIIFSAFVSPLLVRQAHQAGAVGYFSKSGCISELVEGIRSAGRGEHGKKFLGPFHRYTRPSVFKEVSAREREVLLELAKGRSNLAIGEELGMSLGTVKTHLESIYGKLGVSTRLDATRVALAEGYFFIEDIV